MTLTVDLKTQVIHIYYYDLLYLWLYIWYRQDLGVDSNFLKAKGSRKKKINYLTLTVDLERQGQTHFYMTFPIFGCIHDTNIILGSILTKSRSVISNKPKISYMTLTVDLQSQGRGDYFMTFFIFCCIYDTD